MRDLGGGGPEAGGTGLFSHADRAWPSLRLALTTSFDWNTWLMVAPLALVAICVAFAAGARVLPGYSSLLYVFAIAGFTYSTWAFPSLGISTNPALNPIVRLTGEIMLLSAGLVPLLLERAWPDPRRVAARAAAWALVPVAALAYPVAVLAGGAPRFPDRAECAQIAHSDGNIDAVFGRFRNPDAANALLAKVRRLGFMGSQVEPGGCGYLKVDIHSIPTLAVGRDLAAEAEKVGLHVSLEKASP